MPGIKPGMTAEKLTQMGWKMLQPSLRIDAIAHGAEARKQRVPLIGAGDADDAYEAAAAEAQPLHQRDRLAVEVFGRGPDLVAGEAADAHRLRRLHREIAHRR